MPQSKICDAPSQFVLCEKLEWVLPAKLSRKYKLSGQVISAPLEAVLKQQREQQ